MIKYNHFLHKVSSNLERITNGKNSKHPEDFEISRIGGSYRLKKAPSGDSEGKTAQNVFKIFLNRLP
ncbi:hypothetical protein KM043_001656 [Ampulex compressa]|nr:hypothetical protein KM043_001656 [Ampulex compressa]